MEKTDNKYISNAIDELVNVLGIKENILEKALLKTFRSGKIRECIESMADYMGLPIKVNLSFVPASYQQSSGSNRFESSALAQTDGEGRGVECITAQVPIPSGLPFYGSNLLKGFPISVKISENCLKYPETFVSIMVHELSHVLLHSLYYKEKDNEIHTDLTAMILGFSNIVKKGRKVVDTKSDYGRMETVTTTYGYLSDEQFHFAFNRIREALKKGIASKESLNRKLILYRKLIASYKKELVRFRKSMEHLDKKQEKRIRKNDIPQIVLFHQLGYTEKFMITIKNNDGKLKEISDFYVALGNSISLQLNSSQKFSEEIATFTFNLKRDFDLLKNDVDILMKYVGFLDKRKINQQATQYEKSLFSKGV